MGFINDEDFVNHDHSGGVRGIDAAVEGIRQALVAKRVIFDE